MFLCACSNTGRSRLADYWLCPLHDLEAEEGSHYWQMSSSANHALLSFVPILSLSCDGKEQLVKELLLSYHVQLLSVSGSSYWLTEPTQDVLQKALSEIHCGDSSVFLPPRLHVWYSQVKVYLLEGQGKSHHGSRISVLLKLLLFKVLLKVPHGTKMKNH